MLVGDKVFNNLSEMPQNYFVARELKKDKYKELKSRYERLEKDDRLNDVTRNYLQSSLRQIENALITVYGTNFDLRSISYIRIHK